MQLNKSDKSTLPNVDYPYIQQQTPLSNTVTSPCPDNIGQGVVLCDDPNTLDLSKIHLLRLKVLSAGLFDKLHPFVGLKNKDAVDALAKSPLTLSDRDSEELQRFVINSIYHKIHSRWKNTQNTLLNFNQLPIQYATALVLVYMPSGNSPHGTPPFWAAMCSGAWTDAMDILQNNGDPTLLDTPVSYIDAAIHSIESYPNDEAKNYFGTAMTIEESRYLDAINSQSSELDSFNLMSEMVQCASSALGVREDWL
jgi:hypothetical protein